MKKVLYILAAAAMTLLLSCQKDPIGGTAVQDMSGQWYVTVDGAYNDGSEDWEDPFEMGRFVIVTSNTSANVATEMLINDLGTFWDFNVKVNCDLKTMTFSAIDAENYSYESKVTVTDGKIVKNGATTPSGQKADYIEFYVVFDDDEYIPDYWDKLKFSGWRYTGFVNDD